MLCLLLRATKQELPGKIEKRSMVHSVYEEKAFYRKLGVSKIENGKGSVSETMHLICRG
jgi:hypothetical protein